MLWIREEEVFPRSDYGASPKGAESTISMAFVVMCAEKIWRLLRLFLTTIFAWFCFRQWPRCLLISLRNILKLEMADSLAAV